jgi:Ca2+-binding RTX toxin-like protein
MSGGGGDDRYYVDDFYDVVTEAVDEGNDTVYASFNYTLQAGTRVEYLRANANTGLSLTGNEFSHQIYGGGGADILTGGAYGDSLSGGDGDDTLFGGGGNDTMTGGAGHDAFALNAPGSGIVAINDFKSGDVLQISASGFGGGLAANAAVQLITAASAAAAPPQAGGTFIFDNVGADRTTLYWDANGGSGTDAVAIATLKGVSALQANDFKVV